MKMLICSAQLSNCSHVNYLWKKFMYCVHLDFVGKLKKFLDDSCEFLLMIIYFIFYRYGSWIEHFSAIVDVGLVRTA